MISALFAYGTLEDAELLWQITGRRFERTSAVLEGFARFSVRGRPYPGIVPSAGASTPGTLYSGVDEEALARLDRYEGPLYRRLEVGLETAVGARRAYVYAVRPDRAYELSDEPWSGR